MPQKTGTVKCLQVGDDFGFTTIDDPNTGTRETFFLWWTGVTTPVEPPVHLRIMQSNWVSMLRQAAASNLTIKISHPTNSAVVQNVQLGE